MTSTVQDTAHEDSAQDDDAPIPPRSDLKDAIGWTVLGIAVLVGSLRMDRLEQQHINPYTVPGLLPGLLGLVMILLGAVLAVRSWRRGALIQALPAANADEREQRIRIAVVLALCMGYGVVLVGHGIPFWLASTIYVTASILVVQRLSRNPAERQLTLRVWVKALVIGAATSVITQVVFQELFLVRMP
ncbi:MAG: tripartite tricarboxylate transporter TctB family protein [Pseudomonadota bacterium]